MSIQPVISNASGPNAIVVFMQGRPVTSLITPRDPRPGPGHAVGPRIARAHPVNVTATNGRKYIFAFEKLPQQTNVKPVCCVCARDSVRDAIRLDVLSRPCSGLAAAAGRTEGPWIRHGAPLPVPLVLPQDGGRRLLGTDVRTQRRKKRLVL